MLVNIGKGIELSVDTDNMPDNALQHLIYIGARNVLMDSHASHTREADGDEYVANSQATAEKKLAALMAGEVRVTGTREGDPVKAEAIRLATLAIRAAIRKSGKKLSAYDPKAIRDKAVTMIDKYRDQAAKNVAEAKSAEVDVSDLVA